MQHRTRAIWILLFLGCGFTLISFQLIQIQLVQHEKFLRMAQENHMQHEVIAPKRGAILDSDQNILAQTMRAYDLRLDGQVMNADHPQVNLPRLAAALGVSAQSMIAAFNPTKRDALIAPNLDDAAVTRLRALKLNSLIIVEHDKRVYPNSELAAHVLGYVDGNGHGLAGMEKELDGMLSGTPGDRLVERDARNRDIAIYQQHETPATDGCNVTLTIKMAIQHVVEEQLDQIAQTYHPDAAYIVVMDPQNGEVWAMGSRPTYDPNDSKTFSHERVTNRCIADAVEPGSIFKIITLAGALNEGQMKLDTPIFCENGSFYYGGKKLHDDEAAGFGWLSAEEVLAQSSNIGFAKIALTYLGEQKLYNYARAFGIGQRTGIMDNQGESAGVLHPLKDWSGISITRVPMGQEVMASPIQLATAMCVIANGGRLVVPHLAKQVTDESGRVIKTFQPKYVRQVISPNAAHGVAVALHQVTIDGTAKAVKITDATGAGLSYAAKTGTAQKMVNGTYESDEHVASLLGFAPAEDPAFVMLVMVDNPHTAPHKYYGAIVSAPVFAEIAKQVAQIMNIPMDIPPAPVPPAAQAISSTSTTHPTL